MNLKEKFSIAKSYFFIGMFLFGLLFFWAGLPGRNRNLNLFFLIPGFFMLLPFAVLYLTEKINFERIKKRDNQELEDFKNRAEKIEIDLRNVDIKSNKWKETVITDSTKYAGLNDLIGRSDRNMKSTTRNLNHITVNIPCEGKTLKYETNVEMDIDTLKIHFAVKKKTTLYIDTLNKSNMYLCLEFLSE